MPVPVGIDELCFPRQRRGKFGTTGCRLQIRCRIVDLYNRGGWSHSTCAQDPQILLEISSDREDSLDWGEVTRVAWHAIIGGAPFRQITGVGHSPYGHCARTIHQRAA